MRVLDKTRAGKAREGDGRQKTTHQSATNDGDHVAACLHVASLLDASHSNSLHLLAQRALLRAERVPEHGTQDIGCDNVLEGDDRSIHLRLATAKVPEGVGCDFPL